MEYQSKNKKKTDEPYTMTEATTEWQQYQDGLDYKRRINLFSNVDKNERQFSGDQWFGVKSNGLPTPVLNIIKRVIQYKVAQLTSDSTKINFSLNGIDELANDGNSQRLLEIADVITAYTETTWERLGMDYIKQQILKDAAITGDGILYFYWDSNIDAGEGVKGDIAVEQIDNVNYFPGNPNDARVQTQPYIVLAYRKLVSDVREEAEGYGVSKEKIKQIHGDSEYEDQAGDRGKIELNDTDKTIVLLKMWKDKKTKNIKYTKSTRYCNITNGEIDTGRKLYPVAMMNWEERKNSCHGQAEVTGLIPNQIAINKLTAMLIMSVMHTAFPKLLYDASIIKKPTNAIGEAIPVTTGNIRDAATYLQPGQTSNEAYKLLSSLISYTKEMMGANEVALGEVKPDNTSAFIAVSQAVAVPLESIKKRYHKMVEDIGHIWLDFWLHNYNVPRTLSYQDNRGKRKAELTMSDLIGMNFNLKIDVGPGTQWSELASIQALDALLKNQFISFEQYLERIPSSVIPKKELLLEQIRFEKMQQQMLQQQMMQMGQIPQQQPQGYVAQNPKPIMQMEG